MKMETITNTLTSGLASLSSQVKDVLGTEGNIPFIADTTVTAKCKSDPSGAKMKCVVYSGKKSVSLVECPKPAITEPRDAIIKVTKTAICGSDLHLFNRTDSEMKSKKVIGHEAMGVVESIGSDVKKVKVGDKVIVSCIIACGDCYFCKQGEFSACTGDQAGLAGGQAEYIHVPVADLNLLVLDPAWNLSDEKVILLSDILCTAWFACELGSVGSGDVVAIWGAGPVGQLVTQLSILRGAKRVILVDEIQYRLDFAKHRYPQVETVNFSLGDAENCGAKKVAELCEKEPGKGPDVCIDCVGRHYAHSLMHRAEMASGIESDTPESVNAALQACRKGGRVAIIGAYIGQSNHFNLGMIMQKNLTVRSGIVPIQKYWNELMNMTRQGKIEVSDLITHTIPLREASRGYDMFNDKSDGVIKVVFQTAEVEPA